jgi:hypothetical protein
MTYGTATTGPTDRPDTGGADRVVTAKFPSHVWHADLTVVPTAAGLCTSWLPFALPQRWPFCWWLAVLVDHFSRRVMGVAAFTKQPDSQAVRNLFGRTIAQAKATPKYIVCDRGPQFDCQGFRDWCQRKGIKPPRYGALGKHGSIAVVERFILTLKCLLACLYFVPHRRDEFQQGTSKRGRKSFWVVSAVACPYHTRNGPRVNQTTSDPFASFQPRSGSDCRKTHALSPPSPTTTAGLLLPHLGSQGSMDQHSDSTNPTGKAYALPIRNIANCLVELTPVLHCLLAIQFNQVFHFVFTAEDKWQLWKQP